MLSLRLENAGKKFNREWIFRGLGLDLQAGERLAILGGNGSGKSTLLQIIGGYVTLSEGAIEYRLEGKAVDHERLPSLVSFASPYLQLVEDFTLTEMIAHAAVMKPFLRGAATKDVPELIGLGQARHKLLRQFSSGMKQRLKLGLAILADTPLLLLDEPVSNLDRSAITWFREMIALHAQHRTVIVCSNAISEEFDFCGRQIDVAAFKPGFRGVTAN
jgi:ABC-type multidrug transport system ATPase subunit